MSYTVRIPHLPPITKGPVPLNVARNRVTAGGPATQQQIAAFANGLLGKVAKKVLFERSFLLPLQFTGSQVIGRFAGHTSPGVSRARFEVVCMSGSTTSSPPQPIKTTLGQETGLTGAGTTSTPVTLFGADLAASDAPNGYFTSLADFDITADQDYRWTVTTHDGMRVLSCSLYELPRDTVDPSAVTGAVDSTLIGSGLAVCDETIEDVLVCAEKLWKRGGPRLFTWAYDRQSVMGSASTSSATYVNAFDTSVTTVSATSPGFPVRLQYHHSLDSNNVGVTFYAYGAMFPAAGTGDVKFLDAAGNTLATINIASTTNAWYTSTGTMDGTNSTDKIDVHIRGDGTNTILLESAGAFRHVA